MAKKESKGAGRTKAISSQHSAISQTARSKPWKQTRKPKTRKKKARPSTLPLRWPVEFPEVKGKTLEEVKLFLGDDDTSLSIYFADKTHLSFALEPRLSVRSSLADFTTGDWRDIKTWPTMLNESSYADD